MLPATAYGCRQSAFTFMRDVYGAARASSALKDRDGAACLIPSAQQQRALYGARERERAQQGWWISLCLICDIEMQIFEIRAEEFVHTYKGFRGAYMLLFLSIYVLFCSARYCVAISFRRDTAHMAREQRDVCARVTSARGARI